MDDVVGTEVGVDVDDRNVGAGVGADDGMDVGFFNVGVNVGMDVVLGSESLTMMCPVNLPSDVGSFVE
jgi:hypothetical protein